MWTWTKSNAKLAEKETIIKAFPAALRQDVETVIEALPFDHNVLLRFNQVVKVDNLIHPDLQKIYLDKEALEIPSRIYFNEPLLDKENKLTDLQKNILNCLYLRHHNGIIRQKRLKLLLDKNDYFIIPYKFDLLGEYVIEILDDLQKHITTDSVHSFAKFAVENEKYFIKAESRMANYWNVYYRWKSQKLRNYIGRQNIDKVKKRTHNIRFAARLADE